MLKDPKNILWKYTEFLKVRDYKLHYNFPLKDKIKSIESSGIIEKDIKKVQYNIEPEKQNQSIW